MPGAYLFDSLLKNGYGDLTVRKSVRSFSVCRPVSLRKTPRFSGV